MTNSKNIWGVEYTTIPKRATFVIKEDGVESVLVINDYLSILGWCSAFEDINNIDDIKRLKEKIIDEEKVVGKWNIYFDAEFTKIVNENLNPEQSQEEK